MTPYISELHDISDNVKETFVGTLAAGTYVATGTVAAKSEVSQAMCGTGIGQLLSLALGAVSVFLVIKGGFRMLMGVDKKSSSKSKQQMEGNDLVKGGAQTMAVGAVGPAAIAGILDVVGVTTLSCFDFAVAMITVL